MQNYYEILEVSQTAHTEEITKSYKRLALQCHPDIIPRNLRRDNPEISQESIDAAIRAGTERFQSLSVAYHILSDHEKRVRYDSGESTQDFQDSYAADPDFFDAFFKNIPLGAHIDIQSFQNVLQQINQKLDDTINKAAKNRRYRKISPVLQQLKADLKAAEPGNESLDSGATTTAAQLIPSMQIYEFLLDAEIAIQRAKATREPGTHRGLLLGTPILRELSLLGLAIWRFIIFVVLKIKNFFTQNRNPVFQQGLYHGLFKPPLTLTQYHLNALQEQMHSQAQVIAMQMSCIGGKGKSYSHFCFFVKSDNTYFGEEILHVSPTL